MATNFLNRWSQRKLDSSTQEQTKSHQLEQSEHNSGLANTSVHQQAEPAGTLTDENLSDRNINEDASSETEQPETIASLLVSEAEASVKKAALRKLFLSGEFSEVDRLNDYDHDYKSVGTLSSDVANKLRDWINEDSDEENDKMKDVDPTEHVHPTDVSDEIVNVEDHIVDDGEVELTDNSTNPVGQNIPHKE